MGGPEVTAFAVEHDRVQLVWRGMRPGSLSISGSAPTPTGRSTTRTTADRVAVAPETVNVDGPDGAGAGRGGVVVHGLPPSSTVTLKLEGEAVGEPVTVSARTLDRPAGEELSRVATVSDLHIGVSGFGRGYGIVEKPSPREPHPERCTRAAIEAARRWGASQVVAKGDLTHHGQPDQWREYAALVDGSPLKIDAMPGNHDRAFEPGHGLTPEDAARSYGLSIALPITVRDLPGLRLVLVDTTTDDLHRGQIASHVPAVVDAVTDAHAQGAIALVALHHQLEPFPRSEVWPPGIPASESRRFLHDLAATGARVMVTSGHTHRHRRWSLGGVTATQVGSTKDYPGVWAGYVAYEGGLRQVVYRVDRPDCLRWTDYTRRAAAGAWRWVGPGTLRARCFDVAWDPS